MKRCPYCGQYYRQDPRARVQQCCGRAECQRARKRQNLRRWRSLHPDHAQRYAPKERAWAKAYPNYWRHRRKTNREYTQRDNARRAKAMKAARRSANETGLDSLVVEKLQAIKSLRTLGCSANETGIVRRMEAVEDYLLSTGMRFCSAKRNRLD
jgi:hypothetical protein